ncbi:hypothetical protein P7K49_002191 [Saguinus oedipus]|uniref:Uncharacterized protein n=1 Tax=Saguinus oedipus TaxID=9490 RepID=A0ABQ9WH47_SAGOE|nr:hypothetical protein P7K49_002191 [Saguinus oedipus]
MRPSRLVPGGFGRPAQLGPRAKGPATAMRGRRPSGRRCRHLPGPPGRLPRLARAGPSAPAAHLGADLVAALPGLQVHDLPHDGYGGGGGGGDEGRNTAKQAEKQARRVLQPTLRQCLYTLCARLREPRIWLPERGWKASSSDWSSFRQSTCLSTPSGWRYWLRGVSVLVTVAVPREARGGVGRRRGRGLPVGRWAAARGALGEGGQGWLGASAVLARSPGTQFGSREGQARGGPASGVAPSPALPRDTASGRRAGSGAGSAQSEPGASRPRKLRCLQGRKITRARRPRPRGEFPAESRRSRAFQFPRPARQVPWRSGEGSTWGPPRPDGGGAGQGRGAEGGGFPAAARPGLLWRRRWPCASLLGASAPGVRELLRWQVAPTSQALGRVFQPRVGALG